MVSSLTHIRGALWDSNVIPAFMLITVTIKWQNWVAHETQQEKSLRIHSGEAGVICL